jgi:4-aminobutyrate aminotransferase / (S)-3-amino-2-methylpropionate transaminase / 5-aminovalerate transaminase
LAQTALRLPYPDSLRGPDETAALERLEAALNARTHTPAGRIGAILVEPVQGRGGMRTPKPLFLKGLRALAARHKILLIADEIFTGFGRTGRWFGVDHAVVVPDLLCVGKALASGFPLSACIGSKKTMAAWPVSDGEAIHTSTFLGNPLGCAMALASLEVLSKRRLPARAASLGQWWKRQLMEALGSHSQVAEVRGVGLMIGIELVRDRRSLEPDSALASRVVVGALQRGLILLTSGLHRNVLSLTPPLTISRRDLERGTSVLRQVLYEIA